MVLTLQRIRPEFSHCLILFFLLGCSGRPEKTQSISIYWEDDRPTGIIIPSGYLSAIPQDSVTNLIEIHVASSEGQAILGEYIRHGDGLLFKSLIPLTRGLSYNVVVAGETIGEIKIPLADKAAVELTAIFPSKDTLPQNLLKLYFSFSHPMRDGQALKNIFLLKNGRDTIDAVFLDLQPELWNKDYTLLTVWLDPGRIKRDLQPNKKLGEPLESSTFYSLVVNGSWSDTRGVALGQAFRKDFFVDSRDTISPNTAYWRLEIPKANTRDPLRIFFRESLDHVLLNESIQILSLNGHTVDGEIELNHDDSELFFFPNNAWQDGKYSLECEGRLEDLAGNNLNRLFDVDLARGSPSGSRDVFKREFEIPR